MYNKAILAVVATILTALVPALTVGLTTVALVNVAIQGVTAAAVYFGPNTDAAPLTKTILAVLGAVLVTLASVITGGVSSAELIQLILAGLSAAGVYAVANK